MTPAERAAAVREAWLVAKRLRYKLYPHQQRAYDAFKALIHGRKTKRRMAWRWSRRIGKSFAAEVLAVETCLQVAGARIAVISPTEKVLEEFVRPAIEAICADAPLECKPEWRGSESRYLFPNGSQICLYGAANDAAIDNIGRGPAAHGVIFEEAGHIRDLAKARKVVAPQLLGTRGMDGCGWMLFVGTPPESTTHAFVHICRAAREEGREIHYTIHDGHWPAETVRTFIEEEAEGIPLDEYMKTEDYRREFLAELIGDPTRKVLKFADEARVAECVARYKAMKRANHFAVYEGMDVGWSPDWTFWLLAWWDYATRTLVVEKELVWRDGFRHEDMAAEMRAAEVAVLGEARVSAFGMGYRKPSRWSDYSPVLLAELADKHDLIFSPTAKDDRDTAISACDRMIPGYGGVGKLAINPECKELLKQMEAALWNKGRTEFARDAPKRYGHYDGVAALVYLTRNVIRDENPYPHELAYVDRTTHFVVNEPDTRSREEVAWERAFGLEEEAA